MRRTKIALTAVALAAIAGGVGGSRAEAAIPATIAVPGHTHLLHVNANQQSTNWSGWVDTSGGNGYTSVSGNWSVPTVTPTPQDRYGSDWVGIGGDPSPDLIQTGTEEDSVGGHPQYYAWYEILPAPEMKITKFAVHAGDQMTASISGPGAWTITITDLTDHQTFTTSTPYSSSMLTAEWIHEAVTVNGTVSALPITSNSHFDHGLANGRTIATGGGPQSIQMFNSSNKPIATPSALDRDGDGFAVADGAKAPAPPKS